jgi:glycosyltransferase involved in cell wall biosynthesis
LTAVSRQTFPTPHKWSFPAEHPRDARTFGDIAPCPIAYDITRLFLGPVAAAPRGIDRIDLALAEHIFAADGDGAIGVLPTPWGVRAYAPEIVRAGLRHLRDVWSESRDPLLDPVWNDLRARLTGAGASVAGTEGAAVEPPRKLSPADKCRRMASLLGATGFSFGRSIRSAVPRDAIYLNVGQIGLAVPWFFNWLGDRPDVTAVVMLHDVIPLEFPQYVTPSSARHHEQMVRTAAARADAVIVTTRHAQQTVTAALAARGCAKIPTLARGLPLSSVFADGGAAHPDLAGVRYFVVCGSVEPRKNHALLLDIWRGLVARLGEGAPHLVIAGSEGWSADRILGPLAADVRLRARVHHVSGLSSPALKQLLIGSAGLLMPSFAEGFGLPVQEADALGVPTIASDIAAHREIAGAATILLCPEDGDAWERALLALPAGSGRVSPPAGGALCEAQYCRDVIAFTQRCAAGKRTPASIAAVGEPELPVGAAGLPVFLSRS